MAGRSRKKFMPLGVSSSHKLDPDYVKLNEFAESVKQSYLKGYGKQ